ncbi:hypothetical protein AYW79_01120 [Ferroacidibacillus organovorans]|uniref:Uncharacterized protein n=1 Tax=Ferroacidibacillus organovorans TaxID=1765683 RepID=A0A162U0J5_9BACL|nr:hypothetical protein AYJ22_07810 [Ferroacidibacillus organovorans]OAG95300.1 hypothetical protein AYW79_01120 [Ferroacidibacillus organovorans]OPG17157.1 hypothetical protein B2M26_02130 [Ferroacidibacillus organovorans]
MRVLQTLWGLLVDDRRLASILMIALLLSAISSLVLREFFLGAVLIWGGLIVSLVVSVEHQLKLKMKKLK